MDGSYLLDTNIIIGLFANDLQAIQLIEKADEVSIPIISVGELYYGANKSYRKKNNLARIEEFISSVRVIECGLSTAHWYGLIKGVWLDKTPAPARQTRFPSVRSLPEDCRS